MVLHGLYAWLFLGREQWLAECYLGVSRRQQDLWKTLIPTKNPVKPQRAVLHKLNKRDITPCFTQTSCWKMYTGHHLHAVSVQLHQCDTFCLHATIIPNASQLCKHLEITLIKPLWHSSSRNSFIHSNSCCDGSASFPLCLLRGSHQACTGCFSSILWLISNYSISAKI